MASSVTAQAALGTVSALSPDLDGLSGVKGGAAYIRQHRGLAFLPDDLCLGLLITFILSFTHAGASLLPWLWTCSPSPCTC